VALSDASAPADRRDEDAGGSPPAAEPVPARVRARPFLVRREALALQAVVLGVLLLGLAFDAPLGPPASTTSASAPLDIKAPWYFRSSADPGTTNSAVGTSRCLM